MFSEHGRQDYRFALIHLAPREKVNNKELDLAHTWSYISWKWMVLERVGNIHWSFIYNRMTVASQKKVRSPHFGKLLDLGIWFSVWVWARGRFTMTECLLSLQQQNKSNVNVFYSTPSCYAYALNKVGQTYTTKSDDFFPYASRAHSFWTGYFTSRAAFKYYVRKSNSQFQVSDLR